MGSQNDIREGCFGKRDQKWGPEMTSANTLNENTCASMYDIHPYRHLGSRCLLCGWVLSYLLAWCAAPSRYERGLRDVLQEMFTIENSDDSGQ